MAYFEATIAFDNVPEWVRSGLNADIDIVVHKETNVLKIPVRFLVAETSGDTSVFVQQGDESVLTDVTIGFTGNDGWVEVRGLDEGVTVIAP